MTEIIIVAVVSIVVGIAIGMLVVRGEKTALLTKVEMMNTQMEEMRKMAERAMQQKETECQQRLDDQEAHHQRALADQEAHHQRALNDLQRRFDETIAKVSAQLKTATDDMLRQRQREFSESSSANLGQIVNPLKETIAKMEEAMGRSTLEQTKMSSAMKENIESMLRQSEAAKQSADELTRVFKHGAKVQGDWGETILAEVLEAQGFRQGVHYDVQTYIRDANGNIVKSDEGATMRPDVILHLDQRREVIIDSKVSLTAFMDYVNTDNEEKREQYLKAHIDSINKHVKELSTKDYSSYIQSPKVRMSYVIMFVPNTGALWTALNAQPDLWRKAMEKNVYIADEQTLYAALRIVQMNWTQIEQAKNHTKIFELATEMLDRVGQFMKYYQNIGKQLEAARKSYEDGEKKLQPQGQSILQTCGKLQKLGAKQSTKNPLPELVDIDDIDLATTAS